MENFSPTCSRYCNESQWRRQLMESGSN